MQYLSNSSEVPVAHKFVEQFEAGAFSHCNFVYCYLLVINTLAYSCCIGPNIYLCIAFSVLQFIDSSYFQLTIHKENIFMSFDFYLPANKHV